MKKFSRFLSEQLSTLQYHNKLNPVLWENDKLKLNVREYLLLYINAWRVFAKIPENDVIDIILTGGNSNYNYTSHSDIDVHLVIDRSKLSINPELIDEYLQTKKILWQTIHHPTIFGYHIEPYAEDVSVVPPKNHAIYSIKNDKWVIKPQHLEVSTTSKYIESKVADYVKKIDHLISINASEESFKDLKTELKLMRSNSIQKYGEFGEDNLVFKILRDIGVLDRMTTYLRTEFDRKLSLY